MSMFNEAQKMEYVEFNEKSSKTLIGYFKRLANKEEKYNKDIVDMNPEELRDTLRSINIAKIYSRTHFISLMRSYYDWAKLNGKTKNNSIIHLIDGGSIGNKEIIRTKMFKSPEQVQEVLDTALDYVNYENRAKRDSLIVWLLYQGLTLEELQVLQKTDMKPATHDIITNEGKIYPIDIKTELLWQECCDINYVERANSKNAGGFTVSKLLKNKNMFRPIGGNKGDLNTIISRNTLTMILARIFAEYSENNKTSLNVSPLNIKYSGIYYKLYQRELQGEKINEIAIAKAFDIKCENEDITSKTWKWRTDFEDWKLAFGYM